jgi:hypothetical protein
MNALSRRKFFFAAGSVAGASLVHTRDGAPSAVTRARHVRGPLERTFMTSVSPRPPAPLNLPHGSSVLWICGSAAQFAYSFPLLFGFSICGESAAGLHHCEAPAGGSLHQRLRQIGFRLAEPGFAPRFLKIRLEEHHHEPD